MLGQHGIRGLRAVCETDGLVRIHWCRVLLTQPVQTTLRLKPKYIVVVWDRVDQRSSVGGNEDQTLVCSY